MEAEIKYPIGQQSFETLRTEGCMYIDKTRYIAEMLRSGSQYFFLGRPRRFGKSLFLSTLQCFFEGKRNLFDGLYIDSIDWDWAPYPVLRLDLNVKKYEEIGGLEPVLDALFKGWESEYDVVDPSADISVRFGAIIEAAYRKTGKKAVILVDEYDKPLVGNIGEKEKYEHYRVRLASVYSHFKSSADYIQMVFLTGVSRFSKLSIFSDLNNPDDISFDNKYADICGITEQELRDNFKIGIADLADKYSKTEKEICAALKKRYDGYRFAEEGSDVYNPWSLLCAMSKRKIANYWNATGFPSLIVNLLRDMDVNLEEYFNTDCPLEDLEGFDLENPRPLALLYQTGYLTIKDYDEEYEEYRMGIPNEEVKSGLFDLLLPLYAKMSGRSTTFYINEFVKDLRRGDAEAFMRRLQSFFASIPYDMNMDDERNFHNAVYVFVSLLGLKTQAEEKTSDGRIDLTIKTEDYIYIVELKYDIPAKAAMDQIEQKRYRLKYESDPRRLILIGASFSSRTRRIDDWVVK